MPMLLKSLGPEGCRRLEARKPTGFRTRSAQPQATQIQGRAAPATHFTRSRFLMFRSKKRRVVALATVVLAGLSVAAYAYFTQAGNGTGTATVGSSNQVSLAGTITGTLYPDGDPASVSVLVTNNGSGSQLVNDVKLASIDPDAAHASCNTTVPGAFTMADIPVDQTLTQSGTAGDNTTVIGSLQMNDTGVNQDACQGATLTLNFTSN
jgi:hypothetical protein